MKLIKKTMVALALMSSFAMGQTIIDEIKKTGEITLGYGEMTVPFTYIIAGESVPRGFSHDIELAIVAELKEKLNMPDLKVKYQMVDYHNLFDLVKKGTVGLHCGTTANTEERQKELSFSNAFFVTSSRLMAKKDSGITALKDLKGKKVGSMEDTASFEFIRGRRSQLGIVDVKAYDREDHVVEDLEAGKIDAFFMSDAVLAGIVAQTHNPDDWHLVGKGATSQRFGCITRIDPQFKAIADEALAKLYASGEIYRIYDTWFKDPVAPSNNAIGFDISAETKRIYEAPTDKAIGQN